MGLGPIKRTQTQKCSQSYSYYSGNTADDLKGCIRSNYMDEYRRYANQSKLLDETLNLNVFDKNNIDDVLHFIR